MNTIFAYYRLLVCMAASVLLMYAHYERLLRQVCSYMMSCCNMFEDEFGLCAGYLIMCTLLFC